MTLTRFDENKTDDVFIMWRMKQLINDGKLEISGDLTNGWKDFDVKLAGARTSKTIADEATVQG